MTVRIEQLEATGENTVSRLRALRERVYADDDEWCPPLEGKLERELRRPEFAGRQRVFIARRPGEDIGCAVVRLSEKIRLGGESVATIGNFEALDDEEAVTRLLREASKWAKGRGAERVVGPMNGDTWHSYRLSLGPRDEAPFFMEPYNPPYYPKLWQQAGFEQLATYHSLRIDDVAGAARQHRPRWAKARALGYRVEPMTEISIDDALDRVYEMVCVVFADAFLYTPIRRAAFKKLYDGVERLLKGELSFFLVDRDGDDAGFAFVFPDYADAIRAMNGRTNLWAKAKFAAHRSTDTANVKTFGIMPEHRGRGLSSAMAHKYFDATARNGYECANICLIHDDNVGSTKMDAGRGRVLRRYALYSLGS